MSTDKFGILAIFFGIIGNIDGFLRKLVRVPKPSCKNILLNVFSYTGKRFFLICWCQREKIIAFRYKIEPKIDTFGQGDTRVFANVWVEKKTVSWTFSKLFWSSLGSVWALVLGYWESIVSA